MIWRIDKEMGPLDLEIPTLYIYTQIPKRETSAFGDRASAYKSESTVFDTSTIHREYQCIEICTGTVPCL